MLWTPERSQIIINKQHGTEDLHTMTCQSVYINVVKLSARATCGSLNLPLAHRQGLEID